LSSHVGVVHVDGSLALPPFGGETTGRGRSRDTSPASSPVTAERSITKASSNTGPPDPTGGTSDGLSAESSGQNTGITGCSWVVLDSTLSSVPVFEKTLGDLENGSLDGLDGTLNLDDSLGGLGQHFLGSDHPCARLILNLLDFESGSTNDGTHEIMRDQESDRGESADRRRGEGRVGEGSLEQESRDLGVGGSDSLDFTGDREDSVLNTLDDLGDTSLDTSGISDLGDSRTGLTDNDTGFLGRDESTDSEGVVGRVASLERCLLSGLGGDGFCIGGYRVLWVGCESE
jgi:hypothetical protein